MSLQKAILVAKTDIERRQILDRLDQYYLNLSIPNSIREQVETKVDTLLKRQRHNKPTINSCLIDTNVYILENKFRGMLREAMIARCRGDEPTAHVFFEALKVYANSVDEKTENPYWVPLIFKMMNYDQSKARAWLSADQAERLCTTNNRSSYDVSEQYGILGLKYCQKIDDSNWSRYFTKITGNIVSI